MRIANQVRTIVAPCVTVGARIAVIDVERQPALDRPGGVELPASERPLHGRRGVRHPALALAEGELGQRCHDEVVLAVPVRRAAIQIRVEDEVVAAVL